jgi:hypothetical protein
MFIYPSMIRISGGFDGLLDYIVRLRMTHTEEDIGDVIRLAVQNWEQMTEVVKHYYASMSRGLHVAISARDNERSFSSAMNRYTERQR